MAQAQVEHKNDQAQDQITKGQRGRKPRFAEQRDILDMLKKEIITVGENLSYYHKRRLVEEGFLIAHQNKRESGKGRAHYTYTLSPKACTLLHLPRQYVKAVQVDAVEKEKASKSEGEAKETKESAPTKH